MKSAPDLIVDDVRAGLCDWSGQPLLLGCSGGVDSMVLASILHELAWPFEIAHVDYGLREDSGMDAALVRDWSREHDVPCHVLQAGPCPDTGSVQAWARDVRYAFFSDTVRLRGLAGIVLAHHADDQAETVALAEARGSGVDGLSGMARVARRAEQPPLLRPLLGTDRAVIEQVAAAWGVAYRTDSSNQDMRFRRVAIRRHMTPAAKKRLLETARRSRAQAVRWLHELPEELRDALGGEGARVGVHARRIPLKALRGLSEDARGWYVLRLAASLHASAPRRRSWVRAVEKLMDSPPGARLSLGALEGVRDRDALFFHTGAYAQIMQSATQDVAVDLPDEGQEPVSVAFGEGTCRFSCQRGFVTPGPSASLPAGPEIVQALRLNPAAICGKLYLRRWAPGDRFTPLGAPGSTKIKNFLVDSAVPPSVKPFVPVLVDEEGIVCVPGYRAADRFRVTNTSARVLCVEWEPGNAYFPLVH